MGKHSGWLPTDPTTWGQKLVKSAGGPQVHGTPLVFSVAKVLRVLSRADHWDPQLFPFQG